MMRSEVVEDQLWPRSREPGMEMEMERTTMEKMLLMRRQEEEEEEMPPTVEQQSKPVE
jgi:hypothetical protein